MISIANNTEIGWNFTINPVFMSGSGFERQSADELKKAEETVILAKEKQKSEFLCDILINESFGEGIGKEVIKTAYYENNKTDYSSSFMNTLMSYSIPITKKEETIVEKDVSLTRQQTTFGMNPVVTDYSSTKSYSETKESSSFTIYEKESAYVSKEKEEVYFAREEAITQFGFDYAEKEYLRQEKREEFNFDADVVSRVYDGEIMPSVSHVESYIPVIEVKESNFYSNNIGGSALPISNNSYMTIEAQPKIKELSNIVDLEIKDVKEDYRSNIQIEEKVVAQTDYDIKLDTTNKANEETQTENKSIDYTVSESMTEIEHKQVENKPLEIKENNIETIAENKDYSKQENIIEFIPKKEEYTQAKNCENTSDCFSAVLDWMDNKLKDLTYTEQKKMESLSECYADEINHIKKARDLIKERKGDYFNSVEIQERINHNSLEFRLKEYIRKGEVQEGFKLAESFTVGSIEKGDHTLKTYDTKTGKSLDITINASSLYAVVDKMTNGTLIWENYHFIDTETGEERSGVYWEEKDQEMKSCLYLRTIAEYEKEANAVLGDKDEHGMKLNGLIILINGQEPGKGRKSLFNHELKEGDKIELVYKNDLARYDYDLKAA